MTEQQLRCLQFKLSLHSKLDRGGSLFIRTNDAHGIAVCSRKKDASSTVETYYLAPGNEAELTIEQLIEAAKSIEFQEEPTCSE